MESDNRSEEIFKKIDDDMNSEYSRLMKHVNEVAEREGANAPENFVFEQNILASELINL